MQPAIQLNPWVKCLNPSPSPALRLFCFPYAGGGTAIFRPWLQHLPDPTALEICVIQLPGREARLKEPPWTDLASLVPALFQALRPSLDIPFLFFGHSLGGLIGFELAHYLQAHQAPLPVHLMISGCPAPHLIRSQGRYTLPDQALLAELRRLKGTPQSVLDHPELMQMMLPILRADLALYETYTFTPRPPLACDLSVFGGLEDTEVPTDALLDWDEHTSLAYSRYLLPGDHFFLHNHPAFFLQIILKKIASGEYSAPHRQRLSIN